MRRFNNRYADSKSKKEKVNAMFAINQDMDGIQVKDNITKTKGKKIVGITI